MAQYYEATGRRKESTARVRLMGGSGSFTVNDKEAPAYFTRMGDLNDILRAFSAVGQDAAKYDITVTVNGGGVTGQTERKPQTEKLTLQPRKPPPPKPTKKGD